MPGPGTDAFIQTPPNSTGSKVAMLQITDALGNVVLLEKVVLVDPTIDGQNAAVDALGNLRVQIGADQFGASDSRQIRTLLESIQMELKTLNANFAVVFGDGRVLQDGDELLQSTQH